MILFVVFLLCFDSIWTVFWCLCMFVKYLLVFLNVLFGILFIFQDVTKPRRLRTYDLLQKWDTGSILDRIVLIIQEIYHISHNSKHLLSFGTDIINGGNVSNVSKMEQRRSESVDASGRNTSQTPQTSMVVIAPLCPNLGSSKQTQNSNRKQSQQSQYSQGQTYLLIKSILKFLTTL